MAALLQNLYNVSCAQDWQDSKRSFAHNKKNNKNFVCFDSHHSEWARSNSWYNHICILTTTSRGRSTGLHNEPFIFSVLQDSNLQHLLCASHQRNHERREFPNTSTQHQAYYTRIIKQNLSTVCSSTPVFPPSHNRVPFMIGPLPLCHVVTQAHSTHVECFTTTSERRMKTNQSVGQCHNRVNYFLFA